VCKENKKHQDEYLGLEELARCNKCAVEVMVRLSSELDLKEIKKTNLNLEAAWWLKGLIFT
jgi:hypothetical protein